jgi:hypothetical protein
MKPATVILSGSIAICAVWLLGIYVGAKWERGSRAADAGLLCVRE